MGLKQYKVGKSFEEELCWWFRENGYYPEYHEKWMDLVNLLLMMGKFIISV